MPDTGAHASLQYETIIKIRFFLSYLWGSVGPSFFRHFGRRAWKRCPLIILSNSSSQILGKARLPRLTRSKLNFSTVSLDCIRCMVKLKFTHFFYVDGSKALFQTHHGGRVRCTLWLRQHVNAVFTNIYKLKLMEVLFILPARQGCTLFKLNLCMPSLKQLLLTVNLLTCELRQWWKVSSRMDTHYLRLCFDDLFERL